MLLVILVLSVLFDSAGWAITIEDLPDNASYKVAAVDIEGVGFLERRSLRGTMLSVPPPWYKPWQGWLEPVAFNPEILASDLERIRTRLRESGYYEAQVAYDLVPEGEKIRIIVQVVPGPSSRVRSVAIKATDFDLTEDEPQLSRLAPIATGAVFTQEDYDNSRKQIERFYLEQGYAYVEVAKAAVVDTAVDEVDVTYTITRRQPAVFGATTIEGLKGVAARLVEREIKWEAGEPFDPKKLEDTQASLFGLEIFRSVTVGPSNLEARTGVVDVAIGLVEGPQRSLRIGLGYGLEDQVRGQVQWQHNNFVGGGRRLGFRVKASFIEQAVEGEFRQPYFLHRDQTFVLPLKQGRENEPGFTVFWTRLSPRVERRFLPHIRSSIGYNIEYDKLTDVPAETEMAISDFRPKGFLSSITASIERNTASDLLDPRDGSVLSFSIEAAGGPLQGDFNFYRAVAEAKRYFPVFGTRVIATRLRVGAGDGYGKNEDLPLFRRLFAGGINSTRGYGRYKLGPLTEAENPIGGRSLIEGSVEFRTPVYRNLGAAVFFDFGAVNRRAFRYRVADFRYAVGPGIRYATPVGPLRLDIGFPLNPPDDLPIWQIHFSIGQAF